MISFETNGINPKNDEENTSILLSDSEIDNEDDILRHYGYKQIRKICDTLQGELWKASTQPPHHVQSRYVCIKKTHKYLVQKNIAIQGDIHFIVAEDIIKEAFLLHHLTVDHHPIGDYVVQFIDFFQSESAYYLVTEYIDSEMNLKQFVSKCAQYIESGTLGMKEYSKMMKYILWQLCVTVQWMHIAMRCCHLDLCMDNIMLSNAGFYETENGVSINPKITLKLIDFGVGDIFKSKHSPFLCTKQGLNVDNEGWFAPEYVNGDPYDARYTDNWSLGMLLFECLTVGNILYIPKDMHSAHSGYQALHDRKLKEYLYRTKLLCYFTVDSFSLLRDLLHIDPKSRLEGINVLKHSYFKRYFKAYSHRIIKKFFTKTCD